MQVGWGKYQARNECSTRVALNITWQCARYSDPTNKCGLATSRITTDYLLLHTRRHAWTVEKLLDFGGWQRDPWPQWGAEAEPVPVTLIIV